MSLVWKRHSCSRLKHLMESELLMEWKPGRQNCVAAADADSSISNHWWGSSKQMLLCPPSALEHHYYAFFSWPNHALSTPETCPTFVTMPVDAFTPNQSQKRDGLDVGKWVCFWHHQTATVCVCECHVVHDCWWSIRSTLGTKPILHSIPQI